MERQRRLSFIIISGVPMMGMPTQMKSTLRYICRRRFGKDAPQSAACLKEKTKTIISDAKLQVAMSVAIWFGTGLITFA